MRRRAATPVGMRWTWRRLCAGCARRAAARRRPRGRPPTPTPTATPAEATADLDAHARRAVVGSAHGARHAAARARRRARGRGGRAACSRSATGSLREAVGPAAAARGRRCARASARPAGSWARGGSSERARAGVRAGRAASRRRGRSTAATARDALRARARRPAGRGPSTSPARRTTTPAIQDVALAFAPDGVAAGRLLGRPRGARRRVSRCRRGRATPFELGPASKISLLAAEIAGNGRAVVAWSTLDGGEERNEHRRIYAVTGARRAVRPAAARPPRAAT